MSPIDFITGNVEDLIIETVIQHRKPLLFKEYTTQNGSLPAANRKEEAMPMMITEGQKSYLKEILEQMDVDLADYTEKELDELTCRDADAILADLKAERVLRRKRKFW